MKGKFTPVFLGYDYNYELQSMHNTDIKKLDLLQKRCYATLMQFFTRNFLDTEGLSRPKRLLELEKYGYISF